MFTNYGEIVTNFKKCLQMLMFTNFLQNFNDFFKITEFKNKEK